MTSELPLLAVTFALQSDEVALLQQHGLEVFHQAFIETQALPISNWTVNEALVISSARAVAYYVQAHGPKRPVFCVGENTRAALIREGFDVLACADQAHDLLDVLQQWPQRLSLTLACSQQRLDSLPQGLTAQGWNWNEIQLYRTQSVAVKVPRSPWGVVLMSPSGVKSWTESYPILPQTHYFCLGNSTAQALQAHRPALLHMPERPVRPLLLDLVVQVRTSMP